MRFGMIHLISYDFKTDNELISFLETFVTYGLISEYAFVYHYSGLHCEKSHYHICLRPKINDIGLMLSLSKRFVAADNCKSENNLLCYISGYGCNVVSNFDFYKALKS